jgi:hypothetical protein
MGLGPAGKKADCSDKAVTFALSNFPRIAETSRTTGPRSARLTIYCDSKYKDCLILKRSMAADHYQVTLLAQLQDFPFT